MNGRTDKKVNASFLKLLLDILIQTHQLKSDSRRLPHNFLHCLWHQNSSYIVRHCKTELPIGDSWIERCFGGDSVLDLHQATAHRLRQVLSQRGQDHSAPRRNQQFVPEVLPQAGKNDAGRRLAEVESFAGARDTLFCQQGIQCNKQPNIEIADIS